MSLAKHRKHLIRGCAAAAVLAGTALLWFTLHGPERARSPLAVSMETESATFFAAERDLPDPFTSLRRRLEEEMEGYRPIWDNEV